MYKFDNRQFSKGKPAWTLTLIFLVLLGFFSTLIPLLFESIGLHKLILAGEMRVLISGPIEKGTGIRLAIVNAFDIAISMGLASFILFKIDQRKLPKDLFGKTNAHSIAIYIITMFTFYLALPAIDFSQQLNQLINFPEGIAKIAKPLEDQAQNFYLALVRDIDSPQTFIIGLLTMAIIPAIFEELVFRGVLQNLLHKLFVNIHVSIWVTATLFSLFHFQLYSLLPRILLGALLGYSYYWSRNFLVPVIGHFFNNGMLVCMAYYFNSQPDMNLEELIAESPQKHWSHYLLNVGLFILMAGLFQRNCWREIQFRQQAK